jgi:hypothetical protein
MKRWRVLTALLIVVVLSVDGLRYALEKGSQEKREQQKRELGYQSALLSYSAVLRLGMTRKDVEDYLQTKNISFR